MNKKQVVLNITVPNSIYCWDGLILCEYFDNDGGRGTCDINIGIPKYDKETVKYLKPTGCLKLKGEK